MSKSYGTFANVYVRLRMLLSRWAEGIDGSRVSHVDSESPRCLCPKNNFINRRPKDTNQHCFYEDLYDLTQENHNNYNKVFIDDRTP